MEQLLPSEIARLIYVSEHVQNFPENNVEKLQHGNLLDQLKFLLDGTKPGETLFLSITVPPQGSSGQISSSNVSSVISNRSRIRLPSSGERTKRSIGRIQDAKQQQVDGEHAASSSTTMDEEMTPSPAEMQSESDEAAPELVSTEPSSESSPKDTEDEIMPELNNIEPAESLAIESEQTNTSAVRIRTSAVVKKTSTMKEPKKLRNFQLEQQQYSGETSDDVPLKQRLRSARQHKSEGSAGRDSTDAANKIPPIATRSAAAPQLTGDWDKVTGVGLIFGESSPISQTPQNESVTEEFIEMQDGVAENYSAVLEAENEAKCSEQEDASEISEKSALDKNNDQLKDGSIKSDGSSCKFKIVRPKFFGTKLNKTWDSDLRAFVAADYGRGLLLRDSPNTVKKPYRNESNNIKRTRSKKKVSEVTEEEARRLEESLNEEVCCDNGSDVPDSVPSSLSDVPLSDSVRDKISEVATTERNIDLRSEKNISGKSGEKGEEQTEEREKEFGEGEVIQYIEGRTVREKAEKKPTEVTEKEHTERNEEGHMEEEHREEIENECTEELVEEYTIRIDQEVTKERKNEHTKQKMEVDHTNKIEEETELTGDMNLKKSANNKMLNSECEHVDVQETEKDIPEETEEGLEENKQQNEAIEGNEKSVEENVLADESDDSSDSTYTPSTSPNTSVGSSVILTTNSKVIQSPTKLKAARRTIQVVNDYQVQQPKGGGVEDNLTSTDNADNADSPTSNEASSPQNTSSDRNIGSKSKEVITMNTHSLKSKNNDQTSVHHSSEILVKDSSLTIVSEGVILKKTRIQIGVGDSTKIAKPSEPVILDTPRKEYGDDSSPSDFLCVFMTPRVMSPNPNDTPLTKVVPGNGSLAVSIIETPTFPPTPQIVVTPKSNDSQEYGQSYSVCSSSYYTPSGEHDSSNPDQPLEHVLIAECNKLENHASEETDVTLVLTQDHSKPEKGVMEKSSINEDKIDNVNCKTSLLENPKKARSHTKKRSNFQIRSKSSKKEEPTNRRRSKSKKRNYPSCSDSEEEVNTVPNTHDSSKKKLHSKTKDEIIQSHLEAARMEFFGNHSPSDDPDFASSDHSDTETKQNSKHRCIYSDDSNTVTDSGAQINQSVENPEGKVVSTALKKTVRFKCDEIRIHPNLSNELEEKRLRTLARLKGIDATNKQNKRAKSKIEAGDEFGSLHLTSDDEDYQPGALALSQVENKLREIHGEKESIVNVQSSPSPLQDVCRPLELTPSESPSKLVNNEMEIHLKNLESEQASKCENLNKEKEADLHETSVSSVEEAQDGKRKRRKLADTEANVNKKIKTLLGKNVSPVKKLPCGNIEVPDIRSDNLLNSPQKLHLPVAESAKVPSVSRNTSKSQTVNFTTSGFQEFFTDIPKPKAHVEKKNYSFDSSRSRLDSYTENKNEMLDRNRSEKEVIKSSKQSKDKKTQSSHIEDIEYRARDTRKYSPLLERRYPSRKHSSTFSRRRSPSPFSKRHTFSSHYSRRSQSVDSLRSDRSQHRRRRSPSPLRPIRRHEYGTGKGIKHKSPLELLYKESIRNEGRCSSIDNTSRRRGTGRAVKRNEPPILKRVGRERERYQDSRYSDRDSSHTSSTSHEIAQFGVDDISSKSRGSSERRLEYDSHSTDVKLKDVSSGSSTKKCESSNQSVGRKKNDFKVGNKAGNTLKKSYQEKRIDEPSCSADVNSRKNSPSRNKESEIMKCKKSEKQKKSDEPLEEGDLVDVEYLLEMLDTVEILQIKSLQQLRNVQNQLAVTRITAAVKDI